jgi:hypothetical protein
MPGNEQEKLSHLLITGTSTTEPYTSPASGGKTFRVPQRQRQTHGQRLLRQFDAIREQAQTSIAEQRAYGIDAQNGIYLQFESDPDFELKIESLEARPSGIELLSVHRVENRTLATVFVPEGKLDILVNKFIDYLNPEKDSPKGKPRNEDLVASIASISKAALEALWTDTPETMPDKGEVIWWEVWLRATEDPVADVNFFKEHARQMELTVLEETLKFPDRTVVAVQGTKEQMSRSVNLLNCIAELRRVKDSADFFTAMNRPEQIDWVNAALDQITPPDRDSPAVCILDTGINHTHPLLRIVLDADDLDTCDPAWGTADHKGHGTEMAGLATYGDLTELLAYNGPVLLSHQLESVKILPPHGATEAHLYGNITIEAVSRAEINAPDRTRNFCMAVTTTDFRDAGRPSSWSASVDSLCSGANDETLRLIIISAGNTEREARQHYPDNNFIEGIHDPGQAWNALTVGAYTEKNSIDPQEYPGWEIAAPPGDLSPSSCTSMDWSRTWPLKPDIVMEGGNMGMNPTGTADNIDGLDLLSTSWQYELMRPLVNTGDTSAATALASRFAALLQSQYPDYWPETIRAMLIHSAEWTQAMQDRFAPFRIKQHYEPLLRYCGYGVPDIEKALWSAKNSLTLVAQDTLQPFDKRDGRTVTRDLHLHDIPWPVDLLEELGNTPVEMRVTLSYFIEPNPARRGWGRKYSYASHGLRFEVKRPLESLENFQQRINKAARDEEIGRQGGTSPGDTNWTLGKNLRKIGSVHSDTWSGTAVELAQRGYIAIFPVMGWWKSNPRHERWANQARYSLIVTIKTPETEVDLYTPVANMIGTPVVVEIE